MKKESREVIITTDGTVFTDKDKAAKHELRYRLVNQLNLKDENVLATIVSERANLQTILNETLGE